MRVGVIGLGNIGGAIAANLVADGHQLAVFDQDPARVRALSGAEPSSSPEEIARAAEVTFLSLPTPAVVSEVAGRWLRGAPPGSVGGSAGWTLAANGQDARAEATLAPWGPRSSARAFRVRLRTGVCMRSRRIIGGAGLMYRASSLSRVVANISSDKPRPACGPP